MKEDSSMEQISHTTLEKSQLTEHLHFPLAIAVLSHTHKGPGKKMEQGLKI